MFFLFESVADRLGGYLGSSATPGDGTVVLGYCASAAWLLPGMMKTAHPGSRNVVFI
jgi:hypothetical protein